MTRIRHIACMRTGGLALRLFLLLAVGYAAPAQSPPGRCGALPPARETAFPATGLPTSTRSPVALPVVVHILWHRPEENIPDEQVLSQLDALNLDFQALNGDLANVPSIFQDRIASVDFHFCLATVDPTGAPTSGITRTYTDNSIGIGGTPNIHYDGLGGKDAWDPNRYINIWVARFAGGVGGTAAFPGQAVPAEDGIEVDFRQFGTVGTEPPYHLGRTLTHEMGHFFNLHHLWGPAFDSCCEEDDFVSDTPVSCDSYLGTCPVPTLPSSCSEPDMYMNFMNFTDDACMALFTPGQRDRMWAALQQARPGLAASDACLPVRVEEAPGTAPADLPALRQNPVRSRLVLAGLRPAPDQFVTVRLLHAGGWEIVRYFLPLHEEIQLDVSDLSAGMYWLTVTGPAIRFQCGFVRIP